ncbi:hypothetical protein R5O87_18870, partial [Arthrobacter globiformis]|uniref:hypothetical protein n=1 Tax=Arthrobacter globiformis TaxID=1665 RepID=UPI00397D57D4
MQIIKNARTDIGVHASATRRNRKMGLSFGTKAPPTALSGEVVVSGLGKSYGAARVLSDVNLTMNEGEVVS